MIILDTNVVSETMRPRPDESALRWLDSQLQTDLYVTSISISEIFFGLECMADGRRKLDLKARLQKLLARGFDGRILDFTLESARHYGAIMAARRAAGRPLAAPDGQIAAISRQHDAMIATRNTRDFQDCGIKIINPFDN